MFSGVPEFLYHGSGVAFKTVDVRKGRGYKDFGDPAAKETLLRLLKPERLGVQWFVGSQSVADRLISKLEPIDWRECL